MTSKAAGINQRVRDRRPPPAALLGLLFYWLCTSPALPQSDRLILILNSGSAEIYQRVSSAIVSGMAELCGKPGGDCPDYRIEESLLGAADTTPGSAASPSIVVTIGVKAAHYARTKFTQAPKLYTLIPKASANSLGLPDRDGSASAVFLDQPIVRQLNLIKMVSGDNTRLGVLLGPTTEVLRPIIEVAAKSLNIEAHIESVVTAEEIGPALRRTLDHCDILLALPDPLIHNQKNLLSILLSSYHNQIPVIGFSASYVKAGAMLAVYSKPDQIGRQVAEVLKHQIRNPGALPQPAFPSYFSIQSNRSVSRSLGIELPSDRVLINRLKWLEGG